MESNTALEEITSLTDHTGKPVAGVLELWRRPSVDFDTDGKKWPLADLLQLGGYFPLATIEDRLPFSRSSVQKWSKSQEGEIASCFIRVQEDGKKRAITTLVELRRLNELLTAKVQSQVAGGMRPQIPEEPLIPTIQR